MKIFPTIACYDEPVLGGEPVVPATPVTPTDPAVPATPVASDPSAPKGFSQDDVNKFLADDRRKHQEKYQALKTEMTGLLENEAIKGEERERIATQLKDLQAQYRTKEEKIAYEREQAETEYQQQLETASRDVVLWRDRFTSSTIETALQSAAVEHEAYKASQLVTLLRPQTKLIEQLDTENRPTGNLVPMVEMTVLNKETGLSEPMQMTPNEAVEYMKKNPEDHGNLFKKNVRDGIGTMNGTGSELAGNGQVDQRKITTEQYMKLRKENPSALGFSADR